MAMMMDAEAQKECLPEQTETRALLLSTPESQRPRSAAWSPARVVGALVAGAGLCAAGLCVAGGARPAPAARAPGAAVAGLIQEDAWADCDVDWVIKRRVNGDLGTSGADKLMKFEVERHGGGLPVEQFMLDVWAPEIDDGDRTSNEVGTGSMVKFHLADGHPLNLHFSLWDKDHEEKLVMQNFGIGFYDLDVSRTEAHHEFAVAEPSMVARLGDEIEAETLESGKMKFKALEVGLGSDNVESSGSVSNSQEEKYVRLIYNNVQDFVVSFGWTNPDEGIPRQVSFSLHDPTHCSDPLAPPAAPESETEDGLNHEREVAEEEAIEEEKALAKARKELHQAQHARKEALQEAHAARREAKQAEKEQEEEKEDAKREKGAALKKMRAALRAEHEAQDDAEAEAKKVARAERREDLAEDKAVAAMNAATHAEKTAERAQAGKDCAEEQEEVNKELRKKQKEELEAAKEKVEDFLNDRPKHCKDCQ